MGTAERARGFRGPSDLHLHSIRSDGTEPPAGVVQAAHHAGLRTIALTDHDTTAGWAEAAEATASLDMTFLPGMELSARHEWRTVHLLAYLFDPDHPRLRAEMERIREDRVGRAERIVRSIARSHDLTWDDVLAQTGAGATVGRPHIADALVARGLAADRAAAFAGILHPSQGHFTPHYAPDPVAAVELVVAAGGVPILAHPSPSGRERMMPPAVLRELVAHGLAGFEVEHRENTADGKRALRAIAADLDLIVTGSSDYHGLGKPNQPGENTTDDEMVERIIARGSGTAPVYA
ncbi:PHP domain-containing protein [Microbacterium sp. 2P01SA-2]|uniref:PHP domain-containing protein n=1 Tax=unclassified Microbacterium TaxID=2609290 RepID=UPI00399F5B21